MMISSLCHQFLRNGDVSSIPESMLDKLIKSQVVVHEEEDELTNIIEENISSCNDDAGFLKIVIQPSANCQLGCYYCGQTHSKESVSERTYSAIIDRIVGKLDAGNFDKLHIAWFGGEPLMALDEIRVITQKLQTICLTRNIAYESSMVSNGLILKEKVFVELVKNMGMISVELTLDGTEDDHDKHRYTKGKGKSFKTIYNNLKDIVRRSDFLDLGCKISIRCNIDELNKNAFVPLLKKLHEDNILTFVKCYAASIYSWGNNAHKGAMERTAFAQEEILWKSQLFQMGFPAWVIPPRKKKLCLSTVPSSEMIDAFGNVYNCTEISYVPSYEASAHKTAVIENDSFIALPVIKTADAMKLADWNESLRENNFPCHTCNLLPVCGGSCPKQWHEGNAPCPNPKYVMPEHLLFHYLMLHGPQMESSEKQKLIAFHENPWVTNVLSDRLA